MSTPHPGTKTFLPRIRPTRAVWALAALAIVAIAVSVTVLLVELRGRELEHARRETASLTRMLMEQTAQALDATDLALQGIRDRLQAAAGTAPALDAHATQLLLGAHIVGMPQVTRFFVTDDQGRILNSSDKGAPTPAGAEDGAVFRRFLAEQGDGLRIGLPVRDPASGNWTLHLARRIDGADGKPRGLVVAALDLAHFERLYEYMQLDFERPIALYLDDGRLVVSLPRRAADATSWRLVPAVAGSAPDAIRFVSDPHDARGRMQATLGRVAGFPFFVSVTNDQDEALTSWRETALPIAFGGGLVCVFLGIIAALLAIRLGREEALVRALREADDRYLRTIDSVMDAIVAVDESQRITMYNRAAERMFGIPVAEAIGQPLDALIPQRLHAAHREHVGAFKQSGVSSRSMAPQIAITGLRADGSEFPVESTISQTQIGGKAQFTAVLRDITERRRAEAELREMNNELRRLSISLQSVREEERARISRELHDELGQQLTALKLDLSWLGTRLKEGRPAAPETVDAMRHLLDGTIVAVRRISAELRPRILDDLGFGEAVSWQTVEFAKRSGIEVSLHLPAAGRVRDDALATGLFRVVQESLTNVARHANARRVEISLVEDGGALILRVADDGKGLVLSERQDGIGLVSMRERATALGGRFDIIGRPGAGTRIEVRIPAPEQPAGVVEA